MTVKIKGKNGGTLKANRKGHGRIGGRQKGTPNKLSRMLKDCILEAGALVGSDNKGRDGLIGYLKRIAWKYPELFCPMLNKILPLQISGPNDGPVKVRYESPEEVAAALMARGIPPDAISDINKKVFGANVTAGVAALKDAYDNNPNGLH